MITIPIPFEGIERLTVLGDGRILASGYEGHDRCRFALLDPIDLHWEVPVSVPHTLTLEQAALVSPERVLVTGQPGVVVATDPLVAEPLHPPRQDWLGISVALEPDGVLVGGGFQTPSVPRVEVEMYGESVWTALAPLPGPRWGGMGVQARSGRVVLGGRTPALADQFSVDVYDPERDTWARSRPHWSAPELAAASLAKMREISARHHPPDPSPEPTGAMWTSPVAMADGTVVVFVDAAGEFFTSLHTMAWLDPVSRAWSNPVQVPDYVAQVGRPAVGLADGRLVTTGWSLAAHEHRLFTWSRVEGWREGPESAHSGRTPLALLPDGRVLFVAEGSRSLILLDLA